MRSPKIPDPAAPPAAPRIARPAPRTWTVRTPGMTVTFTESQDAASWTDQGPEERR